LTFLDSGRPYVAEIYADAPNADWQDLAYNIAISERPVDSKTVLALRLAPGGGQAIRIRPTSGAQ
jgi:alpha-glucosidase